MKKLILTDETTPIDRLCIQKKISRFDLAKMSGVPVRTLEAWGSRRRIPRDAYVLYRIAQVLDCHIEDLIEPDLVAPRPSPTGGKRRPEPETDAETETEAEDPEE